MKLREIILTENQLEELKKKVFNYGGESLIARSSNPDTIYKLYKDIITEEARRNKNRKLKIILDKNLKYVTRPRSVLICNNRIVGHEFEYDEDDISMLLAPLTLEEKVKYLRKIKEILNYFIRNQVVYGDLKSDNILINMRTGKIKFCDIDDIQIEGLKSDTLEDYTKPFMNGGLLSDKVHIYLHNLMTIDQLLTQTNDCYEEAIRQINLDRLPRYISGDGKKIISYIVNSRTNYKDIYLIDGISPKSIVKYKKR